MRLIKMFGLAAIAAIAAMAFVGASSASAQSTWLCNNSNGELNQCSDPTTSIHAEASNAVLTPSFGGTVTCLTSLAQASVGNLGNPQVATLSTLTWNHCLQGETTCAVSTVKKGTALILKVSSSKANVEFHNTEVLVECENSLHCIYGGLPVLTATSGTKAALDANKLTLTKVSGFFCPSSATWDATYVSLAPIYFKS